VKNDEPMILLSYLWYFGLRGVFLRESAELRVAWGALEIITLPVLLDEGAAWVCIQPMKGGEYDSQGTPSVE
jgi:hypothetical protein